MTGYRRSRASDPRSIHLTAGTFRYYPVAIGVVKSFNLIAASALRYVDDIDDVREFFVSTSLPHYGSIIIDDVQLCGKIEAELAESPAVPFRTPCSGASRYSHVAGGV